MTRSARNGGISAPRGHKTIKRKSDAPGDDALELLREQGVESLLAEIEAGIAADEGPRVPAADRGARTHRHAGATAAPVDEEAVRNLAYRLWEERGCPEGDSERDWHEAERLLRQRASERPTVLPRPILGEQSLRPIAQSSVRHADGARRPQRARR